MDLLINKVVSATGLDSAKSSAAIGYILLDFLGSEEQGSVIRHLVDRLGPLAHEAVKDAENRGYRCRGDIEVLIRALADLGVDETHLPKITTQLRERAQTLVGPDGERAVVLASMGS